MQDNDLRSDAAHMLALSVDATPDMAAPAYEHRLKQFMDFKSDNDLYLKKVSKLYDARVIMSYPQNQQWRAQLKLKLTSDVKRTYETIMGMLRIMRNSTDAAYVHWYVDEIQRLLKQLKRYHDTMRALCVGELVGLWGMMIFQHTHPEHNPIIPMAVYGSMLVGAFGIGYCMHATEKKKARMNTLQDIFKTICQNEK